MALLLQERDYQILKFVAVYGVVTRRQICEELGQPDRSIRRRLAELFRAGYLKRHSAPCCDGMNSIPVYASSRKGLQVLAQELEDDRYLHFPVGFPISQNLTHSVEVAQTHILLTNAISMQETAVVEAGFWFNEDKKIAPFTDPKKTTVMSGAGKSKLCRPDAVFSLRANGAHCFFALEEDRDSTWAQRVFKKKLPGFEMVFKANMHKDHFADVAADISDTFRILFVCPDDKRRESLRREAARQLAGKDPHFIDCFRFISKYESDDRLSAGQLLFAPIAYRCGDDEPLPIVRIPKTTDNNATTAMVTAPHGRGGHGSGQSEVHVNA